MRESALKTLLFGAGCPVRRIVQYGGTDGVSFSSKKLSVY